MTIQIRTIIIALALVATATGLYMAKQGKQTRSVETAISLPPPAADKILPLPVHCPASQDAYIARFTDTHTDATLKVTKAFEEVNYRADFIEPDKNRNLSFVDLNKDGLEDFVAIYTGENWCGSLGCQVEVYIQHGDGSYSGSLAMYAHPGSLEILEMIGRGGFRQMLTPVQEAEARNEYYLWEWNGREYAVSGTCYK